MASLLVKGTTRALMAAVVWTAPGAFVDAAPPFRPSMEEMPSGGANLHLQPGQPPPSFAGVAPRAADEAQRERLRYHLMGPERALEAGQRRLEEATDQADVADATLYRRLLDRIEGVRRPRQVRLSLEDAIRRALEHNYSIQIFRYNPAIETTRVVEAEAAFDALFFTNVSRRNVDQPTPSQLLSTDAEFLDLNTGIRKRLSTGALVSGQYGLSRSKQDFVFQVLNPAYTSSLTLDLRQPLLRNFGLDVNRSLIVIARHDRSISDLQFQRQIRDTLREVEEAYWRVVQARSNVVITAREVADFEQIYDYLWARRDFDILPVNIAAAEADLEIAKAGFVQRRAELFDAEDRLVRLLNDPELNLIDEPEIVPVDFPIIDWMHFDRVAAVQSALENRTEVREQELRIASAKVTVGQAKNAELPQLDLVFNVDFRGLAGNADRSFDELSRTNFITYTVGVEFQVPIGNRAPRAARRRAELFHAQARAQLQSVLEDVILEVNLSARRMETSFDQIAPGLASAEAREREVESHVARAERKDINTLTTELNARRNLAQTRRGLMGAVVDYNIALIDLERAKGTLLQYNNIVVPTDEEQPGVPP